jgi:Holliday junction resolvasome RuvABC DNA-binding subunit
MSKNGQTASRRQRRGMYKQAGFLRIKNTYRFGTEIAKSWSLKMKQDGNEIHSKNVQAAQEAIENVLQDRLNKSIETWKTLGYNAEELTKLEEAYALRTVKTRETLTSDRKKAKKLEREALASLKSRTK